MILLHRPTLRTARVDQKLRLRRPIKPSSRFDRYIRIIVILSDFIDDESLPLEIYQFVCYRVTIQ